MFKRLLIALSMVAALAACTSPAATTGPTTPLLSPSAPTLESPSDGLESPSDSGMESEEPSESPSAS